MENVKMKPSLWQKFKKSAPFTAGALKWGSIACMGVGLGFGGAFAVGGFLAGMGIGVGTALTTASITGVVGGVLTGASAFLNLALPVAILTGAVEGSAKIYKYHVHGNKNEVTVERSKMATPSVAHTAPIKPPSKIFTNDNVVRQAFVLANDNTAKVQYKTLKPQPQKKPPQLR